MKVLSFSKLQADMSKLVMKTNKTGQDCNFLATVLFTDQGN